MDKKFWILVAPFEGIFHFGTPKFGQFLSFLYIYLPEKFHVSSLKG